MSTFTDLICKLQVNMRPHQLDGIFWSELFNHGMKLSVPWSSTAFFYRRRWSPLTEAPALALFQQKGCPLHEGKALPTDRQRSAAVIHQLGIILSGLLLDGNSKTTLVHIYLFWSLPLLWRLSSLKKINQIKSQESLIKKTEKLDN